MTFQKEHKNMPYILANWYIENKRDLPWRDTKDPYLIWISEIILQQTRVNQGLHYYLRFIERFPTIKTLAEVQEEEVLNYWQGLGYYSRARNLHKAAEQLMQHFRGTFPTDYENIKSLKGIGDYTAAAISSFAYDLPHAVVDGNVYRVLSRIFGVDTAIDSGAGKKEFQQLATEILPKAKAALHNQAIMEFGALQCVPVSPPCNICPFQNSCVANTTATVMNLPVKSKKTKIRNRYFNYLYITFDDSTFLQKRVEKDVWQHLYEFPLIETENLIEIDNLTKNEIFRELFSKVNDVKINRPRRIYKHVLSHQHIFAQFLEIQIPEISFKYQEFTNIPLANIDDYPVSRLMELFIEDRITSNK
jgi:A/G-specific adenine glycosylase